MKKLLTITALALGTLIVGLGIFLWQEPLRGERKADYGRVYYFADGFIAEDTSRPTNEFYVVEIDPEYIERVDLDGDGIAIHLKRNAPEELVSNIVSSVRPDSGRVATCRKLSYGYVWRRDVAMDSPMLPLRSTQISCLLGTTESERKSKLPVADADGRRPGQTRNGFPAVASRFGLKDHDGFQGYPP